MTIWLSPRPDLSAGLSHTAGGLAVVYILPTVIAIARQVEGLGWVICLNVIPVGWPAALILACPVPRKEISHAPQRQRPRGQ